MLFFQNLKPGFVFLEQRRKNGSFLSLLCFFFQNLVLFNLVLFNKQQDLKLGVVQQWFVSETAERFFSEHHLKKKNPKNRSRRPGTTLLVVSCELCELLEAVVFIEKLSSSALLLLRACLLVSRIQRHGACSQRHKHQFKKRIQRNYKYFTGHLGPFFAFKNPMVTHIL